MARRRRRKKSAKRTFYNILTVVFVVAIAGILYLIFMNGGGGKQQVTKKPVKTQQTATTKPVASQTDAPVATEVPVSNDPAAQTLIGKWDSDSGLYLSVRTDGTLALGVTGNESESSIYPFSVSGNNLTISFEEGSPVTAPFVIDDLGQLNIQFEDSSLVFTKR